MDNINKNVSPSEKGIIGSFVSIINLIKILLLCPKTTINIFMRAKVKHLCPQTQYDQRSKRRSSKSNKGVLRTVWFLA